jgi:hypothetical protein
LLKNFKINHLALIVIECQKYPKHIGFINFFKLKHSRLPLKKARADAMYLALVRGECQRLGFPETGHETLFNLEEDIRT